MELPTLAIQLVLTSLPNAQKAVVPPVLQSRSIQQLRNGLYFKLFTKVGQLTSVVVIAMVWLVSPNGWLFHARLP